MPLRATIDYLKACQRYRATGKTVSFTNDPAWLVEQAINRRGGWPDDPGLTYGSCTPINGKYPRKASGDYYRHLELISAEINRRIVVRVQRLGEHRWLVTKLPFRFE